MSTTITSQDPLLSLYGETFIEPTRYKYDGKNVPKFEPEKHLTYKSNNGVTKHSIESFGFDKSQTISNVAASDPFSLFSQEAIDIMRAELLRPEILNDENVVFANRTGGLRIRGTCPKLTPFAYNAWTNEKTIKAVSEMAGIDLVPVFDYDIAHVNISIKSKKQAQDELSSVRDVDDDPLGIKSNAPVVQWHTDSYPFVCVLMMSDTSSMIGGETAIRMPNNMGYKKVQGPSRGYGSVLQGKYIEHVALSPLGARERITCVTSYRPANSNIIDDSQLRTVRFMSDLDQLYKQWTDYRLKMIIENCEKMREKLANDEIEGCKPTMNPPLYWDNGKQLVEYGKHFDFHRVKQFIRNQVEYLNYTDTEMVEMA